MKKLLFGILAVTTLITLVACGEKEEAPTNEPTSSVVENTNQPENEVPVVENNEEEEENLPEEEPGEEEEEEVGVGNTDEGMVVLTMEDYLISNSNAEIEEVAFNSVKVYSQEEIEENDAIKSHNLGEGDIVFEIDYELKIADGVEDLMKYTAANGEIDGQYIRNKHNVGILRANEAGYSVDAFGTGF